MGKEQYGALLSLIVPEIVKLIVEKQGREDIVATESFYNSQVYSYLEKEEFKFWHYSPLTLYNLYEEELETGSFSLPEEAC